MLIETLKAPYRAVSILDKVSGTAIKIVIYGLVFYLGKETIQNILEHRNRKAPSWILDELLKNSENEFTKEALKSGKKFIQRKSIWNRFKNLFRRDKDILKKIYSRAERLGITKFIKTYLLKKLLQRLSDPSDPNDVERKISQELRRLREEEESDP